MSKEAILGRITARNVGFDLRQESAYLSNTVNSSPLQRRAVIENTARQIRTYESETLEDNIVSYYPCFIHSQNCPGSEVSRVKLSSSEVQDEKFFLESQIDLLERDGAVSNGFSRLQQELGKSSGRRFFLWISPRGKAGTRGIYSDINYGYHQIYIGEVQDKKVEAYALKSDVEEEILVEWIRTISKGEADVKGKTSEDFLLNPVVRPINSSTHLLETALFSLKEIMEEKGQKKFYKDLNIDNLPQIIRMKRLKQEEETQRIAHELEETLSSDKYLGQEEARKAIGGQLYALYERYANEKGEIKLTGCAGGKMNIKDLLGGLKLQTLENIFSTDFRLKLDILNRGKEEKYEFDQVGKCVSCGTENVALGPCDICRPCDESIRRRNKK